MSITILNNLVNLLFLLINGFLNFIYFKSKTIFLGKENTDFNSKFSFFRVLLYLRNSHLNFLPSGIDETF